MRFLWMLMTALGACTERATIASAPGVYLDPCSSTEQCVSGLSCDFEVCTVPCSDGGLACSGQAACVEPVDRCIPFDRVESVRASLDAGSTDARRD